MATAQHCAVSKSRSRIRKYVSCYYIVIVYIQICMPSENSLHHNTYHTLIFMRNTVFVGRRRRRRRRR